MVIYRLFEDPVFPHPAEADPDGLLALGGDLSPERLVVAYCNGIFPWYNPGSPILWWSPDPRMVLYPDELHVPRSLERLLRHGRFEIRYDTAFGEVVRACAGSERPGQDGTWIVPEMVAAYERLHDLGLAHSAEAWLDGELAGGLYGVALGRVFFGESMFFREPDASKAAFVTLVRRLRDRGYRLIDCQQATAHLARFGARPIARAHFLEELGQAVRTRSEQWLWRPHDAGGQDEAPKGGAERRESGENGGESGDTDLGAAGCACGGTLPKTEAPPCAEELAGDARKPDSEDF